MIGHLPPYYTRDGIYLYSNTIDTREWLSYGDLNGGVPAGISYLSGNGRLDHTGWYFATYAIRMYNTIDTRVWFSYGALRNGVDNAGITCFSGDRWIDYTFWDIATIYVMQLNYFITILP